MRTKHKLQIDVDREKATSQQLALAIEGMDQADALAAAGYRRLSNWIKHQERDIAAGRRKPPGPSQADIAAVARERDAAELTSRLHRQPASRSSGDPIATLRRNLAELRELVAERREFA